MKELIVLGIILENLIFARFCGWWEGVFDSAFYKQEKIAGQKKHRVYMVIRSCFWITSAVAMCLLYRNWLIVSLLPVAFFCILAHFRLVQVGYYHIARNDLDPNTSPNRFKQNGDRRSHSWWDKKLGSTYRAREFMAYAGTGAMLGWFLGRLF